MKQYFLKKSSNKDVKYSADSCSFASSNRQSNFSSSFKRKVNDIRTSSRPSSSFYNYNQGSEKSENQLNYDVFHDAQEIISVKKSIFMQLKEPKLKNKPSVTKSSYYNPKYILQINNKLKENESKMQSDLYINNEKAVKFNDSLFLRKLFFFNMP